MTTPNHKSSYTILALMSGSSLDGVDIACCRITLHPEPAFEILSAETFPYTEEELSIIRNIPKNATQDYGEMDIWFGKLFADRAAAAITSLEGIGIDLVASHGHTLIHLPASGITVQAGDPQVMANILKLPVIARFRQADIDAGGQGAPLVPMCDQIFFSDYDACLNIGGIANISFATENGRVGFDICGANQILNHFAAQAGLPFDPEGELAAAGQADAALLSALNGVPYLSAPWPKSLDNQFVFRAFIEPIMRTSIPLNDKLATATHHIAQQIAAMITVQPNRRSGDDYRLLVTGGGAYNQHLMSLIALYADIQIILPDDAIIQYKEALAMALMAALRYEDRPNFLPSVTGARTAVSGGEIAFPE